MSADQLAVLCRRLADETDAVRRPSPIRTLAESIAARVRDGVPADDLTDDLDDLEDLLLRAGQAAGLGGTRSFQRLPGAGDGHRVLEVLTCPGRSCDRVERPAAEPILCAVHRAPMTVTRLRP
ncbi:hypothetical protein [Cryptosporangium phraense]|uniref:Uncharacterized protein n=1 Tax=Cryptosporangium phraense TaxID=2593070 RepID=A0A545AZT6_9ACTN|nr:hypothetical protein [Cryptosporangium phraense]TQS46840.1 hypothetical protein FL583_00750 [Cryptosporangium phraense]